MKNKATYPIEEMLEVWHRESARIEGIAEVCPAPVVHMDDMERHARRIIIRRYIGLILLNVAMMVGVVTLLFPSQNVFARIAGQALCLIQVLIVVYYCVSLIREVRGTMAAGASPGISPGLHAPALARIRQTLAVSLAMLFTLTACSCTPIGDGHKMTKISLEDRIAAIEKVNTLFA